MSLSRLLGMPFEPAFNASIASVTAAKMISFITSVADLGIGRPSKHDAENASDHAYQHFEEGGQQLIVAKFTP